MTMPLKKREGVFRAAAVIIGLCLAAAGAGLAEAWMRHEQRFANYYELNGLPDSGHALEYLPEPYLHIYAKNARWSIPKTEFTIEVSTNSDGLVGADTPVAKTPHEFRVVAIGDSFTEGVGAEASASYPAVLRRLLSAAPGPTTYTVMNAGISGSDPVYEIELLRRKLLPYDPDLVLLVMNNSDVDDLKRRGGFDRYGPDGQLRGLPLPWWTWAFDRSHLVRAFVLGMLHYDWDLRSPAQVDIATHQAVGDLVHAGVVATQLGKDNGFRLIVLLHPTWWDVQTGKLVPELTEVEQGLEQAGVEHANLLPFFEKEIPRPVPPDYYWRKDFHYTAKGYEVFGRAVYAELEKRNALQPPGNLATTLNAATP